VKLLIGLNIKSNWIPILVFGLIFSCLLFLGSWQLDRADRKQALLEQQKLRKNQYPIELDVSEYTNRDYRYQRVVLRGVYDGEHQFLIDNRVINGVVGFFVMTPLHLHVDGRSVLVNRGWVPLGGDRKKLPQVSVDSGEVTVTGIIDRFPSVGLTLAGASTPSQGWPSVVQVVDGSILSEVLGYSLLPFQVLLDQDVGQGYYRHWNFESSMPPWKHRAYAFQWFALAIMLVILFFGYSSKR